MTAMIISVGGEPRAIIASLMNHQPEHVCFFASQQSVDLVGDIKRAVKADGLSFTDYKVICDDPDDLVHCYERALTCVDEVFGAGFSADSVLVDYTGGTKNMSAALALAAVGRGCRFSYVGGKDRTKNGLGTVKTGREVICVRENPWALFAVEEKKRIAQFVNHFMYEAAIAAVQGTMDRLIPRVRDVWELLALILEAYRAWDRFDHKAAYRGLKAILDRLCLAGSLGKVLPDDFISRVRDNFDTLSDIKNQTRDFKQLHPILVLDLVSNAGRRQNQNNYDDAVARLYRAVEMAGQIEFEKIFGCATSKVDPAVLPLEIREEFSLRYGEPEKKTLKLPLFAVFKVLEKADNPAGRKFFENQEALRKVLQKRNDSILAHGIRPVSGETCEKLSGIVRDLFVPGALIEFPRLHW